MQITTTDIKDIINDLERRFPVETWVMEDVHLWFLIRLDIYFRLFLHGRESARTSQDPSTLRSKARRALWIIRDRPARWRSMVADHRHSALRDAPVDVLMLSYSYHRVLLRGSWYDRFCDPVADALAAAGRTSQLLEMTPRADYRVPRYRASRYIQPAIDRALIAGYLLDRRLPPDGALVGYAELAAHLNRRGLAHAVPSIPSIQRTVRTIHRLLPFFDDLLAKTRPVVVLIAEYYNYVAGALILACRRRGIPTVDLQHGVQGEEHVAYGAWTRHPPDGFELFPDLFWCWSSYESSAIEQWAANLQSGPEAFIGGNLWSEMWRDSSHPLVQHYDSLLSRTIASSKSPTTVLVTPSMLSNLSDSLLEAMRLSSADTSWWLRLHPCIANRRSEARRLLASRSITNCEIDHATDLPLEPLLRHADVNVTGFSSTVIDAELLGVPSILIDGSGITLFPEQVRNGNAILALTTREILQAIQVQRSRRRSGLPGAPPSSSPPAVIQRLLDSVHRKETPRGEARP